MIRYFNTIDTDIQKDEEDSVLSKD